MQLFVSDLKAMCDVTTEKFQSAVDEFKGLASLVQTNWDLN
jgi:hypothetical protein